MKPTVGRIVHYVSYGTSGGEYGREWVIPDTDMPRGGGSGDSAVPALLRQLIDVAQASPAATGRHVGAHVNEGAAAAAFRARYPSGGI